MSAADVASEARSVMYAIRGLRQQTNALCASNFPGGHPGPQKWLDIVKGLLDTAEERIRIIDEKKSTNPARDIREASQAADFAYDTLTLCDGVGPDAIPYPVVIPLQRILDRLDLKNDFFFRAKQEANYELCPFQEKSFKGIRNQSVSLQNAIAAVHWPFIRITVPSKAFSIVPHFAIVAHEIGHALEPTIDWSSVKLPSNDPLMIAKITARLRAVAASGQPVAFSDNSIKAYAAAICLNWFSEIASDAIGYYLTGPAIFFALAEFLLISWSSYGLCDTHPASDMRLQLLHKRLQEGGDNSFTKIFKDAAGKDLTADFNCGALVHTPAADQIYTDMCQIVNGPDSIIQAAVIAEMHDAMATCANEIYASALKHLQKICPEIIYTPERYRTDINRHLEALLYAIPPIETDDKGTKAPTEFPSILNVGWLVLLTKLDEMRIGDKSMPHHRRVEILQGLILKAVELSEAKRLWDDPEKEKAGGPHP